MVGDPPYPGKFRRRYEEKVKHGTRIISHKNPKNPYIYEINFNGALFAIAKANFKWYFYKIN